MPLERLHGLARAADEVQDGPVLGDEKAFAFSVSQRPSGRFGAAEKAAGLCAFLASGEASFVTGRALSVDGGITI